VVHLADRLPPGKACGGDVTRRCQFSWSSLRHTHLLTHVPQARWSKYWLAVSSAGL